MNIYRNSNPTKTEYTFFWSAQGSISRIGHLLGYKTNLNRYEIIQSIFSGGHEIKLQINYKRKFGKFTDTWKLKNTHQSNLSFK